MKLKVTVGNGPFEDVELVSGSLVQAGQIVVSGEAGVRRQLLINSLVTDEQPDLAICTLLSVLPSEAPAAPQGDVPA